MSIRTVVVSFLHSVTRIYRKTMSITGPDDIGFSKTTFFAGSLSVFGGGLLFGVYRVFRKEKTKIDIKSQRPHVLLAFRALGWGTALCFGTFAAAGAAFSYVTKITTLQEFDAWARDVGTVVPVPKVAETSQTKAETKELEDDLNRFVESIVKGTLGSDSGSEGSDEKETKS